MQWQDAVAIAAMDASGLIYHPACMLCSAMTRFVLPWFCVVSLRS
jgi:hypothetical protein